MTDLKLETLIKPISSDYKTGANLRDEKYAVVYYAMKDARQKARSNEKKFIQQESDDTGLAAWREVKSKAIDILSKQSKDLEVLAWLIEALLRTDSFVGLTAGFELAHNIIETFWDELYPEADEEGLESKIAAFIGLNGDDTPGSLIQPLKSIPLTKSNSIGPFALWQYQQALELEKITDPQKRDQRIRDLGFSLADIQLAVKESSAEFYKTILRDLENCREAFNNLDSLLTEKCGHEAPPSSFIRHTLEEIKEHITFMLQDAPFKEEVLANQVIEDIEQQSPESCLTKSELQIVSTNPTKPTDMTVINSRNDALKILGKVANYFSDTEPHSPIPFLLNRAIRWGNMPLPELLKELIQESETKENVTKLTGINLTE